MRPRRPQIAASAVVFLERPGLAGGVRRRERPPDPAARQRFARVWHADAGGSDREIGGGPPAPDVADWSLGGEVGDLWPGGGGDGWGPVGPGVDGLAPDQG